MSRFFRLTELEPYVPGEQPANMERIFVTAEVLNPERSSLIRLEQL